MTAPEFSRLAARADLARLLSALYYQPDPLFAEEGVFASLEAAAAQLDDDLATQAQALGAGFTAVPLDDLLVDYTQLFLGPVQALARPYGSAWIDLKPDAMQESTLALIELCAEAGYELDEEFHNLPDHVAAELELLYQLLFRAAQATQLAQPEAVAAALGLHRRLLDEHLGRWVGPFTAAAQGHARTPFYRDLARLTASFISREQRDR